MVDNNKSEIERIKSDHEVICYNKCKQKEIEIIKLNFEKQNSDYLKQKEKDVNESYQNQFNIWKEQYDGIGLLIFRKIPEYTFSP